MLPLKLTDIFKFLLTIPDAREVITNVWFDAGAINVSKRKIIENVIISTGT